MKQTKSSKTFFPQTSTTPTSATLTLLSMSEGQALVTSSGDRADQVDAIQLTQNAGGGSDGRPIILNVKESRKKRPRRPWGTGKSSSRRRRTKMQVKQELQSQTVNIHDDSPQNADQSQLVDATLVQTTVITEDQQALNDDMGEKVTLDASQVIEYLNSNGQYGQYESVVLDEQNAEMKESVVSVKEEPLSLCEDRSELGSSLSLVEAVLNVAQGTVQATLITEGQQGLSGEMGEEVTLDATEVMEYLNSNAQNGQYETIVLEQQQSEVNKNTVSVKVEPMSAPRGRSKPGPSPSSVDAVLNGAQGTVRIADEKSSKKKFKFGRLREAVKVMRASSFKTGPDCQCKR